MVTQNRQKAKTAWWGKINKNRASVPHSRKTVLNEKTTYSSLSSMICLRRNLMILIEKFCCRHQYLIDET